MLFTEFNMEDALDVRYEEGVASGKLINLIGIARKKLQKGIPAVQEYPEKNVSDICMILQGRPLWISF